jgi:hypothetical protein
VPIGSEQTSPLQLRQSASAFGLNHAARVLDLV